MNLLDVVPAHWTKASVGKYCDVQLGKMLQSDPSSEKDELKRYLRAINIAKHGLDIGHEFSMWIKPQEMERFRLRRGDILVSEGGDAGRTAVFDCDEEFYFQNAINRVRPVGNAKILPEFIYYWFTFLKVAGYVEMVCNVATIAHFTAEKVKAAPLALPPLETQRRIAQFLDEKTARIDGLIEKKRALLDRLSEKRQALITRAVTKGLNLDAPMKSSGIDWLGDIPAHWEVFLVKRHFEVTYGVGGEIDRSLEEGINLLSLPNISKDGRLKLDDVPYTQSATSDLLLRKGDLIFNWRNGSTDHLGKTVRFDMDGDWTHVSFLLRLRAKSSNTYSGFLRYFLNGLRETEFFAYAKAGVNNTFNLFELKNLPVVSPPTATEQKMIADYIDEHASFIDKLSDTIEHSIARLDEYRSALITAAVTGQLELV